MGNEAPWLGDDAEHFKECHYRWLEESNRFRKWDTPEYRDEWDTAEQCGACRYWVPVVGLLTESFGACTNAASPFDRQVRFMHDGCDQFAPAGKNPER